MSDIPRGVWLGASVRLGYPVPISEPYPHVCAAGVWRRDCAACAEGRPREAENLSSDRSGETLISGIAITEQRPVTPLPPDPPVPPGRYAIMIGTEKPFFYVVEPHSAGRVRLREKVSDYYVDPRHPRGMILSMIMIDPERAGQNYAKWLGRCRRCDRELTDHLNPYFERGYGPDCGQIAIVAA